MENCLTFNGRRPPMEDDLQWKTTSNGRRPPIEDDLKILKVVYLSNHLLNPNQICNVSLVDQSEVCRGLKRRLCLMEDDFKLLRVELLCTGLILVK